MKLSAGAEDFIHCHAIRYGSLNYVMFKRNSSAGVYSRIKFLVN